MNVNSEADMVSVRILAKFKEATKRYLVNRGWNKQQAFWGLVTPIEPVPRR